MGPENRIDVNADVQTEEDVLAQMTSVVESDREKFRSDDFQRIISLLETDRQRRRSSTPDWAKLAFASKYPNT